MSTFDRVRVELRERSYDILVGAGLLESAGSLIGPMLKQPRVAVVTDATVAGLYLEQIRRSLEAAGIGVEHISLPPGEKTKDFAHFHDLVEVLLEGGIERTTTLIALGGGVVGDIAGFAASVVLRGIDCIQVPTTLLAQVDSSVGGKTGINSRHGKNLIGSFHQPRLVLADTAVLDTLPARELRAGYAEVVKYGLIDDDAFFAWLEENGEDVLDGVEAARRYAVAQSCRAKARVVAADERESDSRALLNLGHTFAHALEAEFGYGPDLRHGEAVAIGMVMAFDLSVRLGLCRTEDAARVRRHLGWVGLPVTMRDYDRHWETQALLAHMRHDKKVREGRITFVLARGIGRAFLSREVDLTEVEELLSRDLAA